MKNKNMEDLMWNIMGACIAVAVIAMTAFFLAFMWAAIMYVIG